MEKFKPGVESLVLIFSDNFGKDVFWFPYFELLRKAVVPVLEEVRVQEWRRLAQFVLDTVLREAYQLDVATFCSIFIPNDTRTTSHHVMPCLVTSCHVSHGETHAAATRNNQWERNGITL